MPKIVKLSDKDGVIYPKTVSTAVYDMTHGKLLSDYLADLGNAGISYFDDIKDSLPSPELEDIEITYDDDVSAGTDELGSNETVLSEKIVYIVSEKIFYLVREVQTVTGSATETSTQYEPTFTGDFSFNEKDSNGDPVNAKEKIVFVKGNSEFYTFTKTDGLKSLGGGTSSGSDLKWQ